MHIYIRTYIHKNMHYSRHVAYVCSNANKITLTCTGRYARINALSTQAPLIQIYRSVCALVHTH